MNYNCNANKIELNGGYKKMYGDEFTAVTKIDDEFKLDTTLCSDPEWVFIQNERFNSAEHWLNYQGIKTRSEYGDLLPTYNLFLKIGEWLERRITEENDE